MKKNSHVSIRFKPVFKLVSVKEVSDPNWSSSNGLWKNVYERVEQQPSGTFKDMLHLLKLYEKETDLNEDSRLWIISEPVTLMENATELEKLEHKLSDTKERYSISVTVLATRIESPRLATLTFNRRDDFGSFKPIAVSPSEQTSFKPMTDFPSLQTS